MIDYFNIQDFLLNDDISKKLYYEYTINLPIIEYNSHLSSKDIVNNRNYTNISQLFLVEDEEKLKCMRSCGVNEKYITGDSSDYEKFKEYCRLMPDLIGNPLYIRSRLELSRYFGIDLPINESNCDIIWKRTAEILFEKGFGPKDLLELNNVGILCTADDPTDTLDHLNELQNNNSLKLYPSFLADKILNLSSCGICKYIDSIAKKYNIKVNNYDDLDRALSKAADEFESYGCRTVVLHIDAGWKYIKPDKYHVDLIFKKAIEKDGKSINSDELYLWQSQIIRLFGRMCVNKNWVLQLYFYGEMRNNTPLFEYLLKERALPKTIFFLSGAFHMNYCTDLCNKISSINKSPFLRVLEGISLERCVNVNSIESLLSEVASTTALGRFIGPTTEAVSPISLSKHEYFRKVLCNLIGEWMKDGMYSSDRDGLNRIINNVLCENIVNFFDF